MPIKKAFLALTVAAMMFTLQGCTVNGNILGANTQATAGDLPTWGAPLAPDNLIPFGPPPGSPNGGPNELVVEVKYLDPIGYNESGYTQYYIGQTVHFEVRLYNYGVSAFPQINIAVEQQYYNSADCGNSWWGPSFGGYDGSPVDVRVKGQALGGDSGLAWNGVTLPAQHMIVLSGSYTIPYSVCPGLSQTALKITGNWGNVIYYNPEAGVWDPPYQP